MTGYTEKKLDLPETFHPSEQMSDREMMEQADRRALNLFHQAASRVPAYGDFLLQNNIDADKINSIKDFSKIPVVDKKNYLSQYPLADLCWDGKISPNYILSSSSGSTGEPFLWPRGLEQELEGEQNFDIIFNDIFGVGNKRVLYIICFAMGTWISGPFVLACAENISNQGTKIVSITPGIERETVLSLFSRLADSFDLIVFSGYPPYIKDVLDEGHHRGISWEQHDIKFLFAAEGFSEKWRSYIHSIVGSRDDLSTSVNIYGSADAAILGHETPLSVAIRRAAVSNERAADLFGADRLPTLVQYDPRLKYFETVDSHLLFTTRSGLPLVRYSIGDEGNVWTYQQMLAQLDKYQLLEQPEVQHQLSWRLPFVSVFGRSDLTVSLYGLLVYPENVKTGLETSSLADKLTGKFMMSIEQDEDYNPHLLIRAELAAGQESSVGLVEEASMTILQGLKKSNSEYARLYNEMGRQVLPRIELIQHGDQEYFRQGAKQRWVQR